VNGKLFARHFLGEGIGEIAAWAELRTEVLDRFRENAATIFAKFKADANLNEAATEAEIIFPLLRLLGWTDCLPQRNLSKKGRENVPDALLLPNAEAKATALAEEKDDRRYRHGVAILEAKRWQRPLDRMGLREDKEEDTPSSQILLYLRRAAVTSNDAVRWGILTNGRYWRLYWEGARSLSEDFIEFDVAALIGMPGVQFSPLDEPISVPRQDLKVFFILFRRESFLRQPYDVALRTFHEIAIDEGRRWERRVSEDLGNVVFEEVFPELVTKLAERDPQAPQEPTDDYLEEIRRAALTFLYRLLFVFYAEDRNLLPVHDAGYENYSLRKIREDVAWQVDARNVFSGTLTRYCSQLKEQYAAVAKGDRSIGLPPYNGGLFESTAHPLLDRVGLPDAVLAPLIDKLSRHRDKDNTPKWINYRDLSVQHLGSIYERLLEFSVVRDESGRLSIRPNIFARKGSGSYYTHEDLVQLIIHRTVGPLVEDCSAGFRDEVKQLKAARGAKKERLARLAKMDAAARILDLKICDPAMGSGHFLVALVDYLADQVLAEMASAKNAIDWATAADPYISPLAGRIAGIRERILHAAQSEHWNIDPAQLDDRHIVRRMILKRVIYGVDKNEMAVELAKVALWLHTFAVGAPLSFLDHHLRCGDSLFGEWTSTVRDEIERRGGLFQPSSRAAVAAATKTFLLVSDLTDADIAEVKASSNLFEQAAETLEPLRRLMDFWQAVHWRESAEQTGEEKGDLKKTIGAVVGGVFGDPIRVVMNGEVKSRNGKAADLENRANAFLVSARALAAREKFLHWEIAFPDVWQPDGNGGSVGGFDAVIGNPPWDRMKLQEVEWFAERKPEIAKQARADDRKKLIKKLAAAKDPLWRDYLVARATAETAMTLARDSGQFPLLSTGDMNIYSLFVERAARLIHPRGIVGLLTPSGIASDKSAAEFFRTISTSGRLSALFDFENRKVFFADVHASFKFNVIVFGGPEREFDRAQCAFFLHQVTEIDEPDRRISITPAEFAAINPNTGTAPIFRTTRDARITLDAYRAHPILVDRRDGDEQKLWPVRYCNMFHMTNDSNLFKTKKELEREGYYPVGGNLWKKGKSLCRPLYEGKMVQAYDHRAASVIMHPENIHRPAQQEAATLENHRDSKWLPNPQFWVEESAVSPRFSWAVAFKHISSPTNVRTMIAAIIPFSAVGNSLPLFISESERETNKYLAAAPLFLATLNSFALDYLLRQKIQGQNLNLFILEQLPFIRPKVFEEKIGKIKISDYIREQVLHLTCTAVDMAAFARDMGYDGPPFLWEEEDRRRRLARLDALFFHLYGITRDDVAYILDTFPIVERDDRNMFGGRYRTKEMILAYFNAVAAGDLEAEIEI
jgi:hypothetical protein